MWESAKGMWESMPLADSHMPLARATIFFLVKFTNQKLLESLLKKERQNLDSVLKERLTSRALKANENIKEGKVYNRNEVEEKLKTRMGI